MKRYLAIFLTFMIFGYSGVVRAENFIEGMDDVPLMEGMQQITQDDFSFGNEETRLLEAYLTTRKFSFKHVGEFYKSALPQLGWIYQGNRGNDLLFYREGETLEIIREGISPLLVRITVKTKP